MRSETGRGPNLMDARRSRAPGISSRTCPAKMGASGGVSRGTEAAKRTPRQLDESQSKARMSLPPGVLHP